MRLSIGCVFFFLALLFWHYPTDVFVSWYSVFFPFFLGGGRANSQTPALPHASHYALLLGPCVSFWWVLVYVLLVSFFGGGVVPCCRVSTW